MTDEPEVDLVGALAQVRAAYRLIHAYQRRILDLLAVLDEELGRLRLEFVEWRTPYYNAPVRSDSKPFRGRWAWDLLPGYSFWCSWENTDKTKPWRRIFVHVATDTVFEEFKKTARGEPMAEKMPRVEDSPSELWISLYSSESSGFDVQQAWIEASKLGDVLYDGKPHVFEQGGKTFRYRFRQIKIEEFSDENKVTERLIKPLEEWVHSGEYPQTTDEARRV